MKILMTAFEPFGNNQFNSTITALNNIDLENVTKLILPVTYPGAFQYLKSNLNIKPDFIILLGMAASREIITIEERAVNNLSFKIPDNNNLIINNQKISLNNNEYLYSKMNIDDLINHLKNSHYNVEKSIDAGKYICNFLYYKVLEEYDVPSIFIHIPPYKEKEDFDLLNNLLNEVIMYLKKL